MVIRKLSDRASGTINRYASTQTAKVTAAISLPTSDIYFGQVVFLSHFDGANNSATFTDIKGHSITRNGNVVISTSLSKFGGASAYFDGSSGLIVAASPDFSFGLSDLTVEFSVYGDNLTGYRHLVGSGGYATPSSGAWRLYTNNSQLELWQALPNTMLISGGSLSLNTWNYVAITQLSGVLKLWLDGILIGQATNTIAWNDGQNNGLTIGGSVFGLNGYIDDLRISKGIARYTQNFVPPTSSFANS